MKNPLVSITITTKNEEKNIQNCLESIKLQSYKNIETIVVDNGSTDKTKEIARKYTKKVYNKGPERSAQRNYGMIDNSQGAYVMFVDADMIFSPNLVECCVRKIENCPPRLNSRFETGKLKIKNCQLMALHIPEVVLGKNFFSQVRRFERSFYNGTVIDGARFFERTAFIKVGGFDKTMSGPEDWDIDKKINHQYTNRTNNTNNTERGEGAIGLLLADSKYKSWSLEKLIVEKGVNPREYGSVIYHNESEFNLQKYLAKKGYYSTSFDTYVKKWGADDVDVKKQLGLSYRFFGVFTENGKWKKLFSHPILTG
ncbi:MAG: glycosyltransferase, partial [Patescibacteria group bacterium]|nr:glycosyltransferase [Patescibacteria group bacterium]